EKLDHSPLVQLSWRRSKQQKCTRAALRASRAWCQLVMTGPCPAGFRVSDEGRRTCTRRGFTTCISPRSSSPSTIASCVSRAPPISGPSSSPTFPRTWSLRFTAARCLWTHASSLVRSATSRASRSSLSKGPYLGDECDESADEISADDPPVYRPLRSERFQQGNR